MKKHILTFLFLLSLLPAQAQEITFWEGVNNLLTRPANVDTTRIYRRNPRFSLGLFTSGQKAGFDVDVHFDFVEDQNTMQGVTSYRISEDLCQKIGLEVGYGNVVLGYGFEVGPHSAMRKSTFAFNVLGKAFGLHFNYFKITNPFTSELTIGEDGDPFSIHDEFTSNEQAVLRKFAVDAYYVFNNKRFAYPAAYKMGLVQRRTSGSWLLTGRYMQGSIYNSPEAALDSYGLLDCFSTMQASIGGGYSANIVLWHKDPVGPCDEKLRNLTVNLTAMPVITLFNYVKTTAYQYNGEGQCTGENVSKLICFPMPNFIGSAAACLSMGRFYFSAQFSYNWFYFRSRDAYDGSQLVLPGELENISFFGAFHDWTLKGLLVYKF